MSIRPITNIAKTDRQNILLIFLGLAVYLAIIWFYIVHAYQHEPIQVGRFSYGQTYVGEDFSKSLDLSIASKAVYLSQRLSEVKDLGLTNGVRKSVIKYKVSTDKLTEFALMTLPETKAPASGYPTIILCHGYYDPTQYSTTTGYLDDMNFYSRHGFAVIKPDFRGQGLSSLQGRPEGAYFSMAYNTDVMSLISAINQTSYLNKNNVSLWGHSMGAYIALRAAVLSPQVKNVILLSGPVGAPKDLLATYKASSDQDNPVALRLRQAILLKYGNPIGDPKFWNRTSPIESLARLHAHVQIYAGAQDIVVPPAFSAELDKALTAANKQHQYFVYSDGDHGLAAQRPLIWQNSLEALSAKPNGS